MELLIPLFTERGGSKEGMERKKEERKRKRERERRERESAWVLNGLLKPQHTLPPARPPNPSNPIEECHSVSIQTYESMGDIFTQTTTHFNKNLKFLLKFKYKKFKTEQKILIISSKKK